MWGYEGVNEQGIDLINVQGFKAEPLRMTGSFDFEHKFPQTLLRFL